MTKNTVCQVLSKFTLSLLTWNHSARSFTLEQQSSSYRAPMTRVSADERFPTVQQYDERARVMSFDVGQLVWLFWPRPPVRQRFRKLQRLWTGPWRIEAFKSPLVVVIKHTAKRTRPWTCGPSALVQNTTATRSRCGLGSPSRFSDRNRWTEHPRHGNSVPP